MAFEKNISELRRKNGISQEKLAEMVGVSRQAVTKWENGKANPDTENLIRLAEIFDVSVDELCRGEATEKPQAKIHPGGHILAGISLLILAAYCVIGGVTRNFNGETLIMLLILAVPIHCFTHLIFWGMVKSGEFFMLAGFDPNIKYNTENMKRYIAGLDFMLGFETASYLFIIAVTALVVPQFDFAVVFIFGYVISFVAGIFFMGYKYGDKIYCDPNDAKKAKRGLPSSIILLVMIFVSVGAFIFFFELKEYKNNTIEPFPMIGTMFASVGFALAAYLCESKRLKNTDEHGPLFGKQFIVLNLCAVFALVLMAFL